MAHIETWYRCPVCNQPFDNQREAMRCRNQHPISSELWAVGESGKGVRIFDNWAPDSMHGIKGALREADLSDDIHERKRQLEKLERNESHEPDKN
ncbi:MAG TPA: hypothetical protein VHO71_04605 [Caproiciproducens sp.]|nr:hypothetical protein [Caproiciproducens sp.]